MKKTNLIVILILLIYGLAITNIFWNEKWMTHYWTFPYFSGAANFDRLFEWKISISDFNHTSSMIIDEYKNYKHATSDDLISYNLNNYGYVLVAFLSKILFPFFGDIQGIAWLQLIVHYTFSFIIIFFGLPIKVYKILFFILYTVNPLVIHYVTFPFYYFWMFLPSFCFGILILKPEWRNWWVYAATPIMFFSILIRPTTIFLALFFYMLYFSYQKTSREMLKITSLFVIFILGIIFISSSSNSSPWHTMYVGIGAYPNQLGIFDLSDNRGYDYFYSQTSILIDTYAINGNWNNPEIRLHYLQVIKERYIDILLDEPFLLAGNAILNLFQTFSIGYITGSPILTWISTFLGFLIFSFLIYSKQIVWALAILSSSISFALYFPPIPAYNFSAYMLLTLGCLAGLKKTSKQLTINLLSVFFKKIFSKLGDRK